MTTQRTIQLTDEVQEEVRQAKIGLGEMLEGQGKIVRRIGEALQKQLAETPEVICVTIKKLLADEISKGIISQRTIEDACPSEWKDSAKSEAGSKGAAKSAANRSVGAGGDADNASKADLDALTMKVSRLEDRFNSLKTKAEELLEAGKAEGEFVKVPKDVFAAFAEAVHG